MEYNAPRRKTALPTSLYAKDVTAVDDVHPDRRARYVPELAGIACKARRQMHEFAYVRCQFFVDTNRDCPSHSVKRTCVVAKAPQQLPWKL